MSPRTRHRLAAAILALVALAAAAPPGFAAPAQPAVPAATQPVVSAATLPTWLVGCWGGVSGPQQFHERWLAADATTLLGLSHTTRDGRMAAFEFLRIVHRDGRAIYLAQPGGAPPTEFVAATVSASTVTFENQAHDFPKRVSYRLDDATHLLAWIDGGSATVKRIEYPMQREACQP